MPDISVFTDALQQHRLNELGLFCADERDDADASPRHLRIGDDAGNFINDSFCFGKIAIVPVLPSMRHMNVDERGRKALRGLGQPDRNDLFGIELEAEANDGFDAAEVFLEHDASAGITGKRKFIERISGQHESAERLTVKVMHAERTKFLFFDKGRGRADLLVIADNENLGCAQ